MTDTLPQTREEFLASLIHAQWHRICPVCGNAHMGSRDKSGTVKVPIEVDPGVDVTMLYVHRHCLHQRMTELHGHPDHWPEPRLRMTITEAQHERTP